MPYGGRVWLRPYCGSCGDVFFDQLVIRMSSGKLKEESHYYPFGLPIGSMGSAAAGFVANKHKYQSNEYNKEQGLNWMDFHNRQYDPQIGRFLSIDPLAAKTPTMNPYVAMNNDPVNMVDPLGLSPFNTNALPFLNNISPVMQMGSRKDYRPGGDGSVGVEGIEAFNKGMAAAEAEKYLMSRRSETWTEMLGEMNSGGGSWSATQGEAKSANNEPDNSDPQNGNSDVNLPTKEEGGFIDGFRNFHDFMVDKAKNEPNHEVSALELVEKDTKVTRY